MTGNDILYRAFGAFYEAAAADAALAKMINAAVKTKGKINLAVSHNVCKVESDWLDAIERGLVFIGRAIEEERQFIRSDGEVLPIENVRRISKESIRHLSRHSDFITRKQSDEIVPDKLYTVERDSDFAVYENKFLYLLLCTIRDFVRARQEEINAAYKEYLGEYSAEFDIITATRRLGYKIALTDGQDEAVSAAADKQCAEALGRMDKILQSVSFYLRTPLMSEVARTDKLNGPITKTNVLLMNKNFNEALNLYEYLISYEEDGYTVEKVKDIYDPIREEHLRELSVPPLLIAFLVYEHGLGLEEYLEEQFRKEEERRKEEQSRALSRRIAALKQKAESSGEGLEEYALALEEKIKELSLLVPALENLRAENEDLKGEIYRLGEEKKVLLGEIDELGGEVARLKEQLKSEEERHKRELESAKEEYLSEVEKLKAAQAEEIARIKNEAEQSAAELKRKNAEELAKMRETHAAEISSLNKAQSERLRAAEEQRKRDTERLKADCGSKIARAEAALEAKERESSARAQELAAEKARMQTAEREREVLQARLTAMRREYGLLSGGDDFTTEEGFNALEHEFEVLGKLVREQWTEVKKILKKQFYAELRSEMHKKNRKKPPEYVKLSGEVLALRQEGQNESEEGGQSEESVISAPSDTDGANEAAAANGGETDGLNAEEDSE